MLAAFGSLLFASGVLVRSFMRRRRGLTGDAPMILDTMREMVEEDGHVSRVA
jgi:hypothetical protein